MQIARETLEAEYPLQHSLRLNSWKIKQNDKIIKKADNDGFGKVKMTEKGTILEKKLVYLVTAERVVKEEKRLVDRDVGFFRKFPQDLRKYYNAGAKG